MDGPSLAAVLAGGALEPARGINLVAQAAAGLHAVHEAGLVHGDIRPGTLLLGSGDMLKVTDFGLSHPASPERAAAPAQHWDPALSDTVIQDMVVPNGVLREMARPDGALPETVPRSIVPEDPGYLAPERVAGGRGTSASDLYSLGVVAYSVPGRARPVQRERRGGGGGSPGLRAAAAAGVRASSGGRPGR